MKKGLVQITGLALMAVLLSPSISQAQVDDIPTRVKTGGEMITITRKSDTTGKTIIVVDGDNITVNGKPVKDSDNDENITVYRRKLRDVNSFGGSGAHFNLTTTSPNQALLGVTTQSTDEGVKVLSVTKKSAAEKAGLKKDDVITAIDEKSISSPDALSKAIREKKPGEKVSVAYLRGSKKEKITAELGKMEDVAVSGYGSFNDLAFNFSEENINRSMDQLSRIPQTYSRTFSGFGGTPRLGLTVQDTDDGKGVKVLNVSDDSNAEKAGIKEDDVILEVDGKLVNSADEIAKVMKDSKDLVTVKFKYQRSGKTNTVDVKVPRKLKTANL